MLVEEAEQRCRALLHVRGLVRGGQPPHKEQEACTLACLRRDTHTRLSPSLLSLSLSVSLSLSLSLSLCLCVCVCVCVFVCFCVCMCVCGWLVMLPWRVPCSPDAEGFRVLNDETK